MDIAHCMMIDETGNVQQCVSNEANIMCEMHISPADRELCLDKTIASPFINFNASTEITMSVRILTCADQKKSRAIYTARKMYK